MFKTAVQTLSTFGWVIHQKKIITKWTFALYVMTKIMFCLKAYDCLSLWCFENTTHLFLQTDLYQVCFIICILETPLFHYQVCSFIQNFPFHRIFWYLAFKVTNKNLFCQNWGIWKKYKPKYRGKYFRNTILILYFLSFINILSACPNMLHDELKLTK